MNGDFISLTNDALWLVLILSAPPIIVASVAGLLVAIVQAATPIYRQVLRDRAHPVRDRVADRSLALSL
jgi:type III secretion protein S